MLDELTAEQTRQFLDVFNLSSLEFEDAEGLEWYWPGSTPLSRKLAAQAGSESDDDIELYLATQDNRLAHAYTDAAKFCAILKQTGGLYPQGHHASASFGGCLLMYFVSKRNKLAPRAARDLSLYFLGFYLTTFQVFKLVRNPLDRHPDRLLDSLVLELAWVIYLTVVFYRFYCYELECSKWRLTRGVVVAGTATAIGFIAMLAIVTWIEMAHSESVRDPKSRRGC